MLETTVSTVADERQNAVTGIPSTSDCTHSAILVHSRLSQLITLGGVLQSVPATFPSTSRHSVPTGHATVRPSQTVPTSNNYGCGTVSRPAHLAMEMLREGFLTREHT